MKDTYLFVYPKAELKKKGELTLFDSYLYHGSPEQFKTWLKAIGCPNVETVYKKSGKFKRI